MRLKSRAALFTYETDRFSSCALFHGHLGGGRIKEKSAETQRWTSDTAVFNQIQRKKFKINVLKTIFIILLLLLSHCFGDRGKKMQKERKLQSGSHMMIDGRKFWSRQRILCENGRKNRVCMCICTHTYCLTCAHTHRVDELTDDLTVMSSNHWWQILFFVFF